MILGNGCMIYDQYYQIVFVVILQVKTSFKEFATVVCDDPRSATLDAGNVKLTYNALIEKVCRTKFA